MSASLTLSGKLSFANALFKSFLRNELFDCERYLSIFDAMLLCLGRHYEAGVAPDPDL